MQIDIEFNSGAQLPMDAIPELARMAESHGFGCAWGGEANNKDPTVMLSAIAAVTAKIQIGSAVYHILGRTPATLAKAPLADVRSRIRPVNFYMGKGRRVREVAQYLLDHHGGTVPRRYADLLEIPMVGPKTANCVLVYGFGVAAIPVDTHCHRVPNRIGFVRTKTPEETEAALKRLLPRSYWLDVNELVIRFGKEVCRPIGPRCGECEFTAICNFYRRRPVTS